MHKTHLVTFLAIVQVIAFAPNTRTFADGAAPESSVEFHTAKLFQDALRSRDKQAAAKLLRYPLEREYPLPPLKSPSDLINNWDDFFDAATMQTIIADAPAQMGWRGVMLGNGDVWFDGDRVIALNVRTKEFFRKFREEKNKESSEIHPSARGYESVEVICSTATKSIRIQKHRDGYHYFVWNRGAALLEKPELALRGTQEFEGSEGNSIFTFRNKDYSYVMYAPTYCANAACKDTLTISKDGKELSSQICK